MASWPVVAVPCMRTWSGSAVRRKHRVLRAGLECVYPDTAEPGRTGAMADGARGEGRTQGPAGSRQQRSAAGVLRVAGGAGGRLRMTENRVGCVDACALCPVPTCVEGERIERFIVHHSREQCYYSPRVARAGQSDVRRIGVQASELKGQGPHTRLTHGQRMESRAHYSPRGAKIGLSPLGALSRHSADSAPTDVTAHTVHRTNACHLAFRILRTAVARCTSQSPPVSGSSPRLRAAASDPRRL